MSRHKQHNVVLSLTDPRRAEILSRINGFVTDSKVSIGIQQVQIDADTVGSLISLSAPSYAKSKRLGDFILRFERAYPDLKGIEG